MDQVVESRHIPGHCPAPLHSATVTQAGLRSLYVAFTRWATAGLEHVCLVTNTYDTHQLVAGHFSLPSVRGELATDLLLANCRSATHHPALIYLSSVATSRSPTLIRSLLMLRVGLTSVVIIIITGIRAPNLHRP